MSISHFLQVSDLSKQQLNNLLEQAQLIIDAKQHIQAKSQVLKGRVLINLFFEHSTRTRVSFELAAKRLGMDVINIDVDSAALQKGESILDTLLTLQAMCCDVCVIRHAEEGMPVQLSQQLTDMAIINAGDGTHAHPSQALLDMLTIKQNKKDFSTLNVAIIGDIIHSRVAQSQLVALQLLGVQRIHLIAPKSLLPQQANDENIIHFTDMQQGLSGVDVVIVLRVQRERMQFSVASTLQDYTKNYCLTKTKLAFAKPDAIVLHPGPINRDVEIDDTVAFGEQSLIQQQVTNGIGMRMAILQSLL